MGRGASISLIDPPSLGTKPTIPINSCPYTFLIIESYSLLSGFAKVLVGFEKRSYIHGLAPPEVSVNRPVE
jgi:hypothetical protein